MSCVANSYTRYFNTRQKRIGPLLQGAFKAKLVDSDESFLQITRYIHLNPQELSFHLRGGTGGWESYEDYPYSSYGTYLGREDGYGLCRYEDLKEFIKSPADYQEFVGAKALKAAGVGIEALDTFEVERTSPRS